MNLEPWRLAVVREAKSWIGTPYRHCADVKGANGGVDCAMSLVRWFVDTGRLQPFDPRPYSPQWHLNRGEERFLDWIEKRLRGRRVDRPQPADVVVFQIGRCFAHGGVVISDTEMVHAYAKSRLTHISRLDEAELAFLPSGKPRPRLYFEIETS